MSTRLAILVFSQAGKTVGMRDVIRVHIRLPVARRGTRDMNARKQPELG